MLVEDVSGDDVRVDDVSVDDDDHDHHHHHVSVDDASVDDVSVDDVNVGDINVGDINVCFVSARVGMMPMLLMSVLMAFSCNKLPGRSFLGKSMVSLYVLTMMKSARFSWPCISCTKPTPASHLAANLARTSRSRMLHSTKINCRKD